MGTEIITAIAILAQMDTVIITAMATITTKTVTHKTLGMVSIALIGMAKEIITTIVEIDTVTKIDTITITATVITMVDTTIITVITGLILIITNICTVQLED
jgi:hypothetical protein